MAPFPYEKTKIKNNPNNKYITSLKVLTKSFFE